MSKWLLISDLFPIFIFIAHIQNHTITAFAIIASRLCSLVFHVFSETRPYLINLDYMGIASMAFVSLQMNSMSIEYHIVLGLVLFISMAIFILGLAFRTVSTYAQPAILILAFIGNIPAFVHIKLIPSTILFAVGYFIVEPINHTAWHWLASLAQAILVHSI